MISNASPLIFFAKANKLDLLCKVFPKIFIPREVFEEVVVQGQGTPDAVLVQQYVEQGLILVKDLSKEYSNLTTQLVRRHCSLDRGEAETICLALQERENEVLMDDSAGRKVAELNNLIPSGSVRALLLAFQQGFISRNDTLKIMTLLLDAGLYLGAEVLEKFYAALGKIEKSK